MATKNPFVCRVVFPCRLRPMKLAGRKVNWISPKRAMVGPNLSFLNFLEPPAIPAPTENDDIPSLAVHTLPYRRPIVQSSCSDVDIKPSSFFSEKVAERVYNCLPRDCIIPAPRASPLGGRPPSPNRTQVQVLAVSSLKSSARRGVTCRIKSDTRMLTIVPDEWVIIFITKFILLFEYVVLQTGYLGLLNRAPGGPPFMVGYRFMWCRVTLPDTR